jgi:hypothetical protein
VEPLASKENAVSTQAHEVLVEIQGTLATLTKMALDIDPALCTDGDLAELRLINANLGAVEDDLADICAENVEAQGDEFPFEAWDIIADEPVVVVGWFGQDMFRLSSGYLAHPRTVTTDFPAWYVRAQQAEADAREQALDQEQIRNGG